MNKITKQSILEQIDSIVSCYRSCNFTSANSGMIILFENINSYLRDLENVNVIRKQINNINEFLSEILAVFEKNDRVYLCDLLKYGLRAQIHDL